MCACVHVHVCVCVYVHVCVCTCPCVHVCLCVCTCLYVCACVYVHVYVRACVLVCMYTSMCVYMCVCLCPCMHVYKKTPKANSWELKFKNLVVSLYKLWTCYGTTSQPLSYGCEDNMYHHYHPWCLQYSRHMWQGYLHDPYREL